MKEFDIEERVKIAVQNFESGYNCAQSVFLAYSDVFELNLEMAKKMAGCGRCAEQSVPWLCWPDSNIRYWTNRIRKPEQRTMQWFKKCPTCSRKSMVRSFAAAFCLPQKPARLLRNLLQERLNIMQNVLVVNMWKMQPV